MTARCNRLLPALVALAVLGGATLAPAATPQRYKGKVKRFRASMTVSCVSAQAPSGNRVEVYVIAPAGSAKLKHKRFKFSVHLPKQQFKDKAGNVIATLYSVKARVVGKVSGGKASGTAKVTYNRNTLAGGTIAIVSCSTGKTPIKWTAKRK